MAKCSRWIYFIIVLTYASILSIPGQEEPANMHDHAMTHSISNSFPTDRTTSFSTNDDVAISWIEIGNYLRYAHHVSWNWYSPDGKLFKENTHATSVPDVGYYYEWYRTGSPLPIRGYDPASIPGLWKVEVYIDGDYWLTEWFSISSDDQ